MDYENLYKKALERAREVIKDYEKRNLKELLFYAKEDLGVIFPELAGSEDEQIRKGLINYFNHHKNGINIFYGIKGDDILAWLEKQGESYTKRDVDNAYLEGMAFAKDELDKQAEVESDNDDIEAEEKGIREAFNKIEDEKQCKQKSQRMISAEAKEAMYDKPADTVEQKCEESKTKIFDAPTPFEDKLYAFVAACEFLAIPSKIEFILEHSQEILDAAREQIGKEQSSTWSKEDEEMRLTVLQDLQNIKESYPNVNVEPEFDWLKSLKERIGG